MKKRSSPARETTSYRAWHSFCGPDQMMQRERSDDTGMVRIPAEAGNELEGTLTLPAQPVGMVLFAHGSGSSRFSPRNRFVAEALQQVGLGTLLMDLLTREEEAVDERTGHLRFDIALLADRLIRATDWLLHNADTQTLRVGYFGASTGAGAALLAAAQQPDTVGAIVSRGGRPDLAGAALSRVHAPTLLIVGGWDEDVIELNRDGARADAEGCGRVGDRSARHAPVRRTRRVGTRGAPGERVVRALPRLGRSRMPVGRLTTAPGTTPNQARSCSPFGLGRDWHSGSDHEVRASWLYRPILYNVATWVGRACFAQRRVNSSRVTASKSAVSGRTVLHMLIGWRRGLRPSATRPPTARLRLFPDGYASVGGDCSSAAAPIRLAPATTAGARKNRQVPTSSVSSTSTAMASCSFAAVPRHRARGGGR